MKKASLAVAMMLWASSSWADRPETADASTKEKIAPISIGAMAGVGFPRPLSVEAIIVLGRFVAIGGEYSVLPPISVSVVHASMSAVAGDFRIFPFRGAFFIGVKAGLQRLDGGTSTTVPGYGMVSESLLAETWFVNPRIGVMWTWRPGLAIGMEAGVQIPVSTKTQMPATASEEVLKLTTLSSSVLPTVDLLRIGLML